MSIETNLASIAKSLETLVAHLTADKQPAPAAAPAPMAMMPNPAPVPAPAPAVEVPAAAPPAFMMPTPAPAPAPAPAAPAAPFTDGKGLMEYVMGKYRALGPVKGGMIQNVLTEIGCKNINEVQPAQYGEFHARVEAIQ